MEVDTPFCSHCLTRDINLLSCKGCNITFYCNIICQKKNWVQHKTLCKEIQEKDDIYDKIHSQMLKHNKNFLFDNLRETMSDHKIVSVITMIDIENNLKCLKLFKSFTMTQIGRA